MTCQDCKIKREILFDYYGLALCLPCKRKREETFRKEMREDMEKITKRINRLITEVF